MRYAGNKAVTRYRADYRPVNRYHGNKKVAGWKWSEQSGAILPFADTFNDSFQSVKIHGAIVQSGSGNPSPDNVRPFVPVNPQRVDVSGRNLLRNTSDFTNMQYWQASAGSPSTSALSIIQDPEKGSVLKWNFESVPGSWVLCSQHIYQYGNPFLKDVQYTVSFDYKLITTGEIRQGFANGSGQNIVAPIIAIPAKNEWTKYSRTFSALNRFGDTRFYITGTPNHYGELYITNIQLEPGPTAHPYTPYTGTTIPLPDLGPIWGGGYRDYAQGVEYADKARATIAYATGWTFVTSNATYARFQHSHPGAGGSPDTVNCWAENFTATSFYGAGGVESLSRACMSTMFASFSRVDIAVAKSTLPQWNDNWTSAEKQSALGAYIASHPISIVYQLATPTTTHFTPITIPTVPRDTVISAEGAQITARCRVVDR